MTPPKAAQILDLLVPFAILLRGADRLAPFDRWPELVLRFLPHTFFVYWLFSFIPVIGGQVYMLVVVPLAVLRGVNDDHARHLLRAWVALLIGFLSIWGFIGHVVLADRVASEIGWATGSPFQTELAFASLGLGIAALMTIWLSDHLVTGVVIAKAVFWYGAAFTHLRDWWMDGNAAPYNVGGPLIGDLIYPTVLLVLLARAGPPLRP